MLAKSLVVCAALVALVVADPKFAYPKCVTEDTSKCCTLSKNEKMAHHGYFLAQLNGNATVVTCKAGALECHLGNPGAGATNGEYPEVACPNFGDIFESRSGLEVLEGVVYGEAPKEEVNGGVKAAAA